MSKIITTTPSSIEYGAEANIMLNAALNEVNLLGAASDLFGRFPSLNTASLRLSWLITGELIYPRSRRPILAHCLEAAIHAGVIAKGSGRSVRCAYLNALLQNACMLLEINICSGRQRWDPLVDDGLATWYPEREFAHVHPYPSREVPLPSPVRFFAGLALRIADHADLSELPLRWGGQENAA